MTGPSISILSTSNVVDNTFVQEYCLYVSLSKIRKEIKMDLTSVLQKRVVERTAQKKFKGEL